MAKKKEKAELVPKEETRPDFSSPFSELESYFDRFFRQPFSMMTHPAFTMGDFPKLGRISPSVDIFEEGDEMVVKADIPGISKEDLSVSITENTLTISGEKKQEEKVEKKDFHRVERSYGSFCRNFRLPDNVNGDKAKASFNDGVLEVRIPKSKAAKAKQVPVS